MAAGTPTYPTILDTDATLGPTSTLVAGSTTLLAGDQIGLAKNWQNTIIALETIVGVTNSSVTTTHEYRIRKAAFSRWQAALQYSPPAILYAVFGTQNNRAHLAFNDSATWGAYFHDIVPLGAAMTGGIIVRLYWKSITTNTGNVVWGAQVDPLTTAESADTLTTQVTATTACSATTSVLVSTAITIATPGLTAGAPYMLLIQRLGANASDTMVGDACLRLVSVENAT